MGRGAALALSLLALAACEQGVTPPVASSMPAPVTGEVAADLVVQRSAESLDLERFYTRVESNLVAQGLLRMDGGGPDAPFGAEDLTRNFERIALYEEYANQGGRLVARQTASKLHRWSQPIRMQLVFGPTVAPEKQARDRAVVTGFASRLARLSGVPIRQVSQDGNFVVFVVNEDERRALAPRLREIIPGIGQAAIDTVIDLPRTSYCLVFAWDPDETGSYERAVAVIRGEHPDLLRLSCVHEEIAQGMGLSNDSPSARPSVFNDDEEFGLLTTQDEMLMRMLYDRRLTPGMSAEEAAPIAAVIAQELMGGAS